MWKALKVVMIIRETPPSQSLGGLQVLAMMLAAQVSCGLLRNYPLPFLCCFPSSGTHWFQKARCQLTWKTHFLCGEFKVQPAHWGLNFTLQLQHSNTETATILSFLCLVFFLPVLHFSFFFRLLYTQACWRSRAPSQPGAQEYSEHQHRAPSKARLPKEQKNPEASLRTPRASWLVQQDSWEVRTGLVIPELSKSRLRCKT